MRTNKKQRIKLINYSLILNLIVVSLLFTNCQAPEPISTNSEEQKRAVYFSISAEGNESNNYIKSRSSSTDIVAIQIYNANDEKKDAIAYGLFDSYAIPPFELVVGANYIIEATTIINGQKIVAKRNDGSYYNPFTLTTTKSASLTNSFIESNTPLRNIFKGDTDIQVSSSSRASYKHLFIERFAGNSNTFTAAENMTISINMKRVYGAMRITPEGLTKGSLEIAFDGSPALLLGKTLYGKDTTVNITLAGTETGDATWFANNYSENLLLTATYVSDIGDRTVVITEYPITIVRNKLLPLTIKSSALGSIDFTIESGDMEEQPGINIE